MAIKRVRVCTVLNGVDHFYVRESEQYKVPGKPDEGTRLVYVFEPDRRQAQIMNEDSARIFIRKLHGPEKKIWLEDVATGLRVTDGQEQPQIGGEDLRKPYIATLDDENDPNAKWYLVKPALKPEGPRWYLTISNPRVSGQVEPVYATSPLEVLEKAQQLGFLAFAGPYIRPVAPVQEVKPPAGPMRRPGSFR